MYNHTKTLIQEMSVGVICYDLLLAVLALVLQPIFGWVVLPVLLGLLVGMIADILMLIHMGFIMERVLDSANEEHAKSTTILQGILRKVVFVVAALICIRIPQINAVAMLIGALGLKAGAYLQPFVHAMLDHISSHKKHSALDADS